MESIDDFQLMLDGFNKSASALLPWSRIGKIESLIEYHHGVIKASNVQEYAELRDEIESLKTTSNRVANRVSLIQ